jgi:glycogen debranching enzyme
MGLRDDWIHQTKQQRKQHLVELVGAKNRATSPDYIQLVRAGDYGVYASMGPNFTYAIFGRDSIEVAEDLMITHQALVRKIIFTLARLQGVKNDSISEEEPGKIHHEYRNQVFNGKLVSPESLTIMHKLQSTWGNAREDEMVYYGSFDATPLYIRLIHSYTKNYGKAILDETYINRNDREQTIFESMKVATEWLVTKIEQSPWKLLEYRRMNPQGLLNQVWKDSGTAYLHPDGTVANADDGLASTELQGYAYDALLGAAELQEHTTPDLSAHYRKIASELQGLTLELLWMPEQNFFAQGLDRDEQGSMRQIKTLTSNGALLLQSQLLKDLSVEIKVPYVEAIATTIYSDDFLTEAGVRCRALRHKDIPDFIDYHGVHAVWPKETFDIANGLLNHGYYHLAEQLNNRVLRSIELAGDFFELFYVEDNGEIWYDNAASVKHFSKKSPSDHLPVPEPGQAWAISAVLSILGNKIEPLKTVDDFEDSLFKNMPKVYPITTQIN